MRQHFQLASVAGVGLLGLVTLGSSGCLPSISDLDEGPLTSTFAVSDFFTPSGFMGDGANFGNLVGTTNQNCRPRPVENPHGNCYSFTYYPNRIDKDPWAGVFWVFPANSWGSTYGHAIDMSKFTQVSFWAAIDAPMPYTTNNGVNERFNALVGGIDPMGSFANNPNRREGAKDYLDGVKAFASFGIGGTGLTSEMKQFHVVLTDLNKSDGCVTPDKLDKKAQNCVPWTDSAGQPGNIANDLIGAFGWSIHYPTDATQCRPPADATLPADWCHTDQHSSQFVNPAPVTIYLDDIVWETQ